MLHHDFCTFSFSEILALLMPSVEGTWKIWRTKEVDWGPSANISNVLHQVTTSLLAQGNKESKSNTFWMLDSDCRTDTTCDSCHDFIRTPFWTFKYFLESLSSLFSNGSGIISISVRSQPQSSFYYIILFCPRCCDILSWPNGPCIKLHYSSTPHHRRFVRSITNGLGGVGFMSLVMSGAITAGYCRTGGDGWCITAGSKTVV